MQKTGRNEPVPADGVKSGSAKPCPDCMTPGSATCAGCLRRQEVGCGAAKLQREEVQNG